MEWHWIIHQVVHFTGGFNQPIMCGGEPRAMLCKNRGSADDPIYSIQICIPKHGMCELCKFTHLVSLDIKVCFPS